MREPSNVTDAKAFPAGFAPRGCQHQCRGNPGQTGDADFGEGSGESKSSEDREGITREWIGPEVFQPSQIAAKCRKLQAPSSKLQTKTKLQIPGSFRAPCLIVWGLRFGASLELGTWSL